MELDQREALSALRRAFASPVAPPVAVYDASGRHLECNAVQEWLAGRPWSSLPASEVLTYPVALSFMTADGFRHYLPAFLAGLICHLESADVLVDTMLHYLDPTVNRPRFQARFGALTSQQRSAVRVVLGYLAHALPPIDTVAASTASSLLSTAEWHCPAAHPEA